jgi:hypothetical protein
MDRALKKKGSHDREFFLGVGPISRKKDLMHWH